MKLTEQTMRELELLCKKLNLMCSIPKTEEQAQKVIREIKANWGE